MLNKKLSFISSALVFLYSATLLVSGKSYSYITIIFCIVALLFLPITLKNKLPSDFYKIGIALLGYFLITTLSILLLGGKLSNLDMPSRTILVLPAFIFLLSSPPRKEWLFMGIIVGALASGLIATYHSQILHIRAFKDFDYMVIQSGNIAMSLGIFSLIIAIQYIKERKVLLATVASISTLAGISASLLSGARGGWIILPLILIGLFIIHRHLICFKLTILLLIILTASSFISYDIAEKRINKAVEDISQFTEKHNSNTSIGARIEMWKSGVYTFLDNPIFGTGYQNRNKNKQYLVDNNLVDPIVLKYRRLHNSYLEELSVKGTIGLLTLMLFFCYPLYLFIARGDIKNCVYSQLGAAHITLVMGYSVTQNYINHHSGILHYLMFTLIFYAMLHQQQQTPVSENNKAMQ